MQRRGRSSAAQSVPQCVAVCAVVVCIVPRASVFDDDDMRVQQRMHAGAETLIASH
jgi:hypothetical protein